MNQQLLAPTPFIDEYACRRGLCLLGETGTGVSYALLNMITIAIQRNKRLLLIDPHGDLIQNMQKEMHNVEVWNVGKQDEPYYLDLFAMGKDKEPFQIAEEIIGMMYLLYDPNHSGILGPRFEHAIRNTIVALLDAKQASFCNLALMLTDEKYLQSIISHTIHEGVRRYFTDQLANTSDFHKSEVLDYIISKISTFLEPSSFIGNLTEGKDKRSFLEIIQNTKGPIALNMSYLASQPRHIQDIVYNIISYQLERLLIEKNENMQNILLCIDEANRLNHLRLDNILTYARKCNVEVVYSVRNLSFSSKEAQYVYLAGKSVIVYRVAPPDAKMLESYFDGYKTMRELTSLPNFQFVARMRTKEGIQFVDQVS